MCRDELDTKLVLKLKNVSGLGIAEVQERLSQGKASHLFRAELYLNDHVEVDSKVRETLAVLKAHAIDTYILEIPHDQSWDAPVDEDSSLMSEDELIDLLDDADEFS